MSTILKTEAEVVYTAEENLGSEYNDNYYAGSSFMADKWGEGLEENPARKHLMESDRVYTDKDTNIRRFRVNPDDNDSVNDYYCVALGRGFAIEAALLSHCNVVNDVNGNPYQADETNWGYTFKVEYTDDKNNLYYINVIMIESKNSDDDNTNDPLFKTHLNGLIEFITSNNSYGFEGTKIGRDNDPPNLDYDKFFSQREGEPITGIKITSVSAYVDGWMEEGSYANGYTIREDRNGIPTTSDMPQNNIEEYIKRLETLIDNGAVPSDAKADIERELAWVKEESGREKPDVKKGGGVWYAMTCFYIAGFKARIRK